MFKSKLFYAALVATGYGISTATQAENEQVLTNMKDYLSTYGNAEDNLRPLLLK